jgi:hypothetical protein
VDRGLAAKLIALLVHSLDHFATNQKDLDLAVVVWVCHNSAVSAGRNCYLPRNEMASSLWSHVVESPTFERLQAECEVAAAEVEEKELTVRQELPREIFFYSPPVWATHYEVGGRVEVHLMVDSGVTRSFALR